MSRMGRPERRKHRRVTDALSLSIETQPPSQSPEVATSTYVVSLSVGGMGFVQGTELPTDRPVQVTLFLGEQTPPVRLRANVVECVKNTCADRTGFKTRLMFTDVDSHSRNLLESHVNHVFNQTRVIRELPYRQSA